MANEFIVKNGLISPTIQSTVSTGTAPLTVASTTLVTNLNADKLDGYDATSFGLLGSSNAWTNTNTFSGSLVLSSTLSAGGSVGTAGQVLKSTGTGVEWGTASGGSGITTGKAIAMAMVFG
jgi:hypothetical protein